MMKADEARAKSMSSEAHKKSEEAMKACLNEIEAAITEAASKGKFEITIGVGGNIIGGDADPHIRLASLLYFMIFPEVQSEEVQSESGLTDLHLVDVNHTRKVVDTVLASCGYTLTQHSSMDLTISWEL